MRVLSVGMAILVILSSSVCMAAGYEITKVVEVGPLNGGPLYSPIKWSPDGNRVAYFSFGYLMIADTLGNSRRAAKVEMSPGRFEWLSHQEILVYEKAGDDTIFTRLTNFNINTGERTVLAECVRRRGYQPKPEQTWVEGPYLTLEGNAYYYVEKDGGRQLHLVQSAYKEQVLPEKNHIYRRTGSYSPETGGDVYVVRADLKDSIRAFDRSYSDSVRSPNRSHILMRGVITRLADSSLIIMNSLIGEYPEGTVGCDFPWASLNPRATEALFCVSCDDGQELDPYIVNRIGTINYATNEFTILDTLIGIDNGMAPTYAPDGRNIAFFANGKLYIIKRREK